MKKVLLSSLMMGMFCATAAVADTTSTQLTTKNYVDSGLQAVYNKAKGLANAASQAAADAQTTADQAVGAISGIQDDINDINDYVGNKTMNVEGVVVQATGLGLDIENLEDDVATLTTDVGNKANLTTTNKENLVGAINEIKESVSTLSGTVTNQQVQAGAGVSVQGSTVRVNGLDATTAADAEGLYVFQGNEAKKLNVATTWNDPDWLN